jgi:ankyrin repeat protein
MSGSWCHGRMWSSSVRDTMSVGLRRVPSGQAGTALLLCAVLLASAGRWCDASPKRDRLNALLLAAASKNDVRGVVKLLAHGADINARNEYRETALIVAARQRYPALARALLDRGANIHLRDQTDQSAFTLAAINGDTETVAALIRKGAKAFSRDGDIALVTAARDGTLDLVRLLIDHGAPLTEKAGDQPALIYAAASGQTAVVRFLLARGAKVDGRSPGGPTALMEAAQSGRTAIVQLLLEKGALVNLRNSVGDTALEEAATFGHTDAMKLLLDAGADPNIPDREGATPLKYAMAASSVEAIKLLLDHGVDPNARDLFGQTPLMTAGGWGRDDIAQLLLQRGADATAKDQSGRTALLMAAQGGANLRVAFASHPHDGPVPTPAQVAQMQRAADQWDADLVRSLFTKGVDSKGSEGSSALLLAAAAGHTAVVRALLDAGADINVQSTEALARLVTFPTLLDLERKNAEPSKMTPLMYAAENGRLAAAKVLLDKGAKTDMQDASGMTALLYAARNGDSSMVQALLERGADVRARNDAGKTALMLVAEGGAAGVLGPPQPVTWRKGRDAAEKAYLARRKAEYSRWRAAAVRSAAANDTAIVKALLARGADVNASDREGNTALILATKAHHAAVLPILSQATTSGTH